MKATKCPCFIKVRLKLKLESGRGSLDESNQIKSDQISPKSDCDDGGNGVWNESKTLKRFKSKDNHRG